MASSPRRSRARRRAIACSRARSPKLDEQIKEIDRLRDQIQAVLARKQVVETLQANRSEAVHLLDQLVRQLPDGIYLSQHPQTERRGQRSSASRSSNARVSTLMRNIEASPWLSKPELVEIKAGANARHEGQRQNQ